jgi:hypothetical protein
MNVIAGIDIDRKYPAEEIISMYHKGLLKPIALEGYVVRADADMMIGFVPWHESTLARAEAGRAVNVDFTEEAEQMREDVERTHPIVRTSPQEKQARVAMRILGEVHRSGSIGLSDEQVSEIAGEFWKEGDTVSGETIRAVAAHFLSKAEQSNKEADGHRVTRQHKT